MHWVLDKARWIALERASVAHSSAPRATLDPTETVYSDYVEQYFSKVSSLSLSERLNLFAGLLRGLMAKRYFQNSDLVIVGPKVSIRNDGGMIYAGRLTR